MVLHRRIQDPNRLPGEIAGKVFQKIGPVVFGQCPVLVEGDGRAEKVASQQDGKGDVETLGNAHRLGKIRTGAQDDPGREMLGLPLPVDGGIGDDRHALLEEVGNVLSLIRQGGQGTVEAQGSHRVDAERGHSREKFDVLDRKSERIPEGLGTPFLPEEGIGKGEELRDGDLRLVGLMLGSVDERRHPGIEAVKKGLLDLGILEGLRSVGGEDDRHLFSRSEGPGLADQIIGPNDSPL